MRRKYTALSALLIGSVLAFSGAATVERAIEPGGRAPHETVLYSFFEHGSVDGAGPLTGVIAGASGALYGVTAFGGTYGGGTAFKLTPSSGGYVETPLYEFGAGADGYEPEGLVADAAGALYTNTLSGGSAGQGTVVKLTPSGSGYSEQVLYSFTGRADGGGPIDAPVIDRHGAVFGVTAGGGSYVGTCGSSGGCGVVYEVTPSRTGYTERTLYRFPGGAGGSSPQGGLASDGDGTLFGTTYFGGNVSACRGLGCGVVFKLSRTNGGYATNIVYVFRGADGGQPNAALTFDEHDDGAFGTTQYGGNGSCAGNGCGTVYRLTPSGSSYRESVLYSFKGGRDGWLPQAPVTIGQRGILYGSAFVGGKGGNGGQACWPGGCGTVFRLTPSGSRYVFSVLHEFSAGADGAQPQGRLIADPSGALYGTTRSGGGRKCNDNGGFTPFGCGVVYKIVP